MQIAFAVCAPVSLGVGLGVWLVGAGGEAERAGGVADWGWG